MASWRSLTDAVRRFWRRPVADRLLLVQTLVLVTLTCVALRVVGFRRWQALLSRFVPPSAPGMPLAEVRRLAAVVRGSLRRAPFAPTCLRRSLALWWLLRRRGAAAELRIGVRKAGDKLEAHAWVEYLGAVLNDRDDVAEVYARFDRAVEPGGC